MERILAPAPGRPEPALRGETDERLNIAVVFTSGESTSAALREAACLANSLAARITLVVPQVVPYPLPLESPPVLLDFSESRCRDIASQSPVETSVRIYLGRDRFEILRMALNPGSLVVMGGRKRWWLTGERALARRLRKAGYEVVFKETE
jgi:hypothetical protein